MTCFTWNVSTSNKPISCNVFSSYCKSLTSPAIILQDSPKSTFNPSTAPLQHFCTAETSGVSTPSVFTAASDQLGQPIRPSKCSVVKRLKYIESILKPLSVSSVVSYWGWVGEICSYNTDNVKMLSVFLPCSLSASWSFHYHTRRGTWQGLCMGWTKTTLQSRPSFQYRLVKASTQSTPQIPTSTFLS